MGFCLSLLACTADEEVIFFISPRGYYFSTKQQKEGHIDVTVRALELAIVPELQSSACDLLCCLAKTSVETQIYVLYPK